MIPPICLSIHLPITKRTSATLLALTLAACGGSSGSDDDPFGGAGGGSSGGAATIASAEKVDFPAGSPDIAKLRATNDGLYVRVSPASGNDVIYKRTTRGTSPGRWMQWTLPVVNASFSPSLTENEGVDEFGIHWVGITPGTAPDRYGTASMNNGGISLNYVDDRAIALIVPDGDASTSGLSWGLRSGAVYRQSRSGTASTTFSARYELVASINDSGLGDWPTVADGTGNLYAASGSDLYRIGATGDVRSWDFSSLGFGFIHTLIYKYNRLWIGYGTRVLTLPLGSNTVSSFATLDTTLAGSTTEPQFCIAGGTLYGSDGMAYDGLPSLNTPRPWLQGPGTMSPQATLSVTEMRSAVSSGMYCAGTSTPRIYAPGVDLAANGAMKLFVISPR
jgi:hypothetical protein